MRRLLVVGLGNPGEKYLWTRHNAGVMVLHRIAERLGVTIRETRFRALCASAEYKLDEGQVELLLLQPQTFMNLSGESVAPAAKQLAIPPEDWIVLHDEIELVFGEIRRKSGGGHKGHNGLRSIIAQTEQRDFERLRFGVDRPPDPDVAAHVLAPFSVEERDALLELLDEACDMIEDWIRERLQTDTED